MTLGESLGALRERQFRLLFTGQTLSNLGGALVPIALAFAVLELTGSATDLGLVLLASRLPQVALVLAGGVVGDRLPRRRVMLASDLVRCATQATTAVLLATGTAQLWQLRARRGARPARRTWLWRGGDSHQVGGRRGRSSGDPRHREQEPEGLAAVADRDLN